MQYPRLLIAAGSSGSGKTLITCGLLQALVNRGIRVTSFKCGPDYIDPMFHTKVIGTRARNLDTFFTDNDLTRYLFHKQAKESDVSIIEGVMGYYDGLGGIETKASTYELATVLDAPVILVVNGAGMSLSIVAYIKGFLEYKKDSCIKGVLLNQVSAMIYPKLKKVIEKELGISVFGYIEKLPELVIESRHLGLLMPFEIAQLSDKLNQLAMHLEATIDIDRLLSLAQAAPAIKVKERVFHKVSGKPVIGIARDEAFCFLYEDNIELLQELGAEVLEFSPLHDSVLPLGLDGLILPGGYPELYTKALSANDTMKNSIREFILGGKPCLAECGGFLYLHTEMEAANGTVYPMLNIIAGKAYRTDKLSRFGYITLTVDKPQILLESASDSIRGHEFHYYESTAPGDTFYAQKPTGSRGWKCIHGQTNLLAGFPHFYYYSNPQAVQRFLKECVKLKNNLEV